MGMGLDDFDTKRAEDGAQMVLYQPKPGRQSKRAGLLLRNLTPLHGYIYIYI